MEAVTIVLVFQDILDSIVKSRHAILTHVIMVAHVIMIGIKMKLFVNVLMDTTVTGAKERPVA